MKKLTTPILSLVLMAACFGASQLAVLKTTLRSSPPLVNSLVASGAIKQSDADTTIKDFTDGAGEAIQLGECMKAVSKDAPDRKQQQYRCAHAAFTGWRAIANRGHFKIHPKIETAFTIADGIFEFIDAFYADRAGVVSHSDVGADGLSDEDFQQALDQRIKELKAAMQP